MERERISHFFLVPIKNLSRKSVSATDPQLVRAVHHGNAKGGDEKPREDGSSILPLLTDHCSPGTSSPSAGSSTNPVSSSNTDTTRRMSAETTTRNVRLRGRTRANGLRHGSKFLLIGLLSLGFNPASMAAVTAGSGSSLVNRWEFSATLTSVWGTGNGLPGFVNGATIVGWIEAANDFQYFFAYESQPGNFLTIYKSPSAVLNYLVSANGNTYSYSLTGVNAIVTQKSQGNCYRVEFSAPFFQLAKDGIGSSITDPSFETFSAMMARGLSDGTGHVLVANGNWINSNMASLTGLSMSIIPEPSCLMLASVSVVSLFLVRRRSSRWIVSKSGVAQTQTLPAS